MLNLSCIISIASSATQAWNEVKVRVRFLSVITALILLLLTSIAPLACQRSGSAGSVVIYTSVDQPFSEPILKKFEEETGIRVLEVYDVEAAKTTGLVNRLIAEKDRPLADVWWSGEFAQTIMLQEEDVLASYNSPSAADIPAPYRDAEGYWTGFAGRARILLVNTDMVSPADYPESIFDLLDSNWPADKIGIAHPLFGTTATHAAALYAVLGQEEGKAFFQDLHDRGVKVLDGNSVVRDQVADGRLMMGLTDTDDACGALRNGAPVTIIFPDQDEMGTLVIPNTVSLIAGAPHPEEAKALIDFLLSREVEEMSIESGWSHIALRPVGVQPEYIETADVKGMNVNLMEVFQQFELSAQELRDIFVQ
ncbi:extracellular solute-binding protein [Chloroflexota bacterium]